MMKWEYLLSEVGWTLSGEWARIQAEAMAEYGAEGWELVSVVLLETDTVRPHQNDKNLQPFLVHAVAMYFKRPVTTEDK